jgi:hypothetical protein
MTEDKTCYCFDDSSVFTRGFTWAMSAHPHSEMVHRACRECGRVAHYPSGAFDVTVEGGTKYPDYSDPGSGDGSDLFRDITAYPRVSFCTDRILRLAGQHRLTGFRFEPMAGPFDARSKGIDYLKGARRSG